MASNNKSPRMGKRIGTHSGVFHCDEALACYMLKQLPEYSHADIIRTREPEVLDQCDIVVDVGGVYDPSKNRFDHHQRGFNETLSSVRPDLTTKFDNISNMCSPRPGFPQRITSSTPSPIEKEEKFNLENVCLPSKKTSPPPTTGTTTFDYLYEFSETRKVLEEFFKCPPEDNRLGAEFEDLQYELRQQSSNSGGDTYVGKRLAKREEPEFCIQTMDRSPRKHYPATEVLDIPEYDLEPSDHENNFLDLSVGTASSSDLRETEVGLQVGHSPEATDCDSNCGELDSEVSPVLLESDLGPTIGGGLLGKTPPPPSPAPQTTVSDDNKSDDVEAAIKDIRLTLQKTKTLPMQHWNADTPEIEEQEGSPVWVPSDFRQCGVSTGSVDSDKKANSGNEDEENDTDLETDRLLGQQRTDDQGFFDDKDKEPKKKNRNKEDVIQRSVLIEGVLFRAQYLGSTQLVCQGQPTKTTRMMQAEEAVSRIKAPEGEAQPSIEVDLFISTEKIMVLNTDLKEIMMDHALRTISYIADIGNLVVFMAKRRFVPHEVENAPKKNKTPKMICHVFESEEAQFIAQSIGQAFQVAYMEFLKANGIEDHSFVKEMDYQEVLNSQEIFGDELEMFAKKEMQKEVVVPKAQGEILGVVIVESGWGSTLPTVVIANLAPAGAAARCGQLNIGDQIIAINGVSLVGLPLSTCQGYIKNCKTQNVVKLTVVPCPPVVEVKIKRPDTKYQLGFSVQNGVICSLLRGGIAERGGVRVGHRIIEINNQSVVAVPHEKIVNLLATSVGEISMKTMPTSMFRLSSAGLVYAHFGLDVISQLFKKNNITFAEECLKPIYTHIYEGFVEELDAIDNGIPMYADGKPRYRINTHLSARIHRLNPAWNDDGPHDLDSLFRKAVSVVGQEFEERVVEGINVWWPARALVKKSIEARKEVHPSGQIIVFKERCSWKDHLYAIEEELGIQGEVKFCLFNGKTDSWRVQGIPIQPDSFVCRVFLHEAWRGVRDEELSALTGIKGCVFCHASGFIGGNTTKEGALEMALKSLEVANANVQDN